MTSPDYSAARSAYVKARDAFALAEKLYVRAQDLYQHGAIAEADLQQAQSNETQAHADLESSADALRAWESRILRDWLRTRQRRQRRFLCLLP